MPLFREADDSAAEIQGYMEQGEVLVARHEQALAGHLQLISDAGRHEIKSLAVIERARGHGIGAALVRAGCGRALAAGADRVVVSTAAAGIENLRFYQRLGFRMDRIVRDYFNEQRGYPADLRVDGIPLRDQVWLSMALGDRHAD
jgi:ribosomal protein S18 acetylase RimI-like enzyme